MLETIEEIDEIVEEQVGYKTFIEEIEEFFRLGNKFKKRFRMSSQKAWEIILNEAEEDFPYAEVRK